MANGITYLSVEQPIDSQLFKNDQSIIIIESCNYCKFYSNDIKQ